MGIESDAVEVNRRENARLLATRCGGQAAFAERIDRSPGQVNHLLGKNPSKNIGKRVARHIEACFGKPGGWLDANHWQKDVQVSADDHLVAESGRVYASAPADRATDADQMYAMAESLPKQALIEYLATAATILSGADQVALAEKILHSARKSLP
jgi:hypothetical protein